MDALIKFFSGFDLGLFVVAGLMLLVCVVPFVQVFTDLRRLRLKKGD